ncbi:DeoR family transcriptional regulator, partial [Streptococcus agalactiae]
HQTFILMDSSKIGQVTFAKVKEINDINLVTNKTGSELMTIIKEKMKVIQV